MEIILSNRDERLVKDAVKANIGVSAVASRSATHYHSREEQELAVREAIEKARSVSREIPLLIASMAGARGRYIQEAIMGELGIGRGGRNRIVSPTDWDDNHFGDTVIRACFKNLDDNAGTPYVLRMFGELAERRVNNARTRRYIMSYIFDRDPASLEFMAVKYRSKLRDALTHVWGTRMTGAMIEIISKAQDGITDEKSTGIEQSLLGKYLGDSISLVFAELIVLLVFGNYDFLEKYEGGFPVINQFFRAMDNIDGCDLVPEEVLTGLLSDPDHSQHNEYWSTPEKQAATLERIRNKSKVETANQAVRKTKQERERGITRETSRVSEVTDPIALLKTIYENGRTNELYDRVGELAVKASYKDFPYKRIGVIKDRSNSMRGHWQESKNTPRAVVDFMGLVLAQSAEADFSFTSQGGATDLATAFLNLVDTDEDGPPGEYEAIFVLSDGYENTYEGLFGEIVDTYRKRVRDIPIYHVSPIGVSEANARARSLSGAVSITATHKTLPMQVASHLLEADVRKWIENRVLALTGG